MVKIGNIELRKHALLLAPMEGVTDIAFRDVCKKYGADMTFTEFVASDGLIRNVKSCKQKMQIAETERPIGIQLFGKHVDAMVQAAQLVEQLNPDVIDLNFGCPVNKIALKGAGAGLLKNIPLMIQIAKAVVEAVKIPVTAKTRLGWDEKNKNVVDIAEQLQDVGIKAITIHGRTREQLFKGLSDWTLIGEVKNNPRMVIPIIGNGDIDSPEKAKEMFSKYGVDAIMIGRHAIGKPWLFRDIKYYIEKQQLLPQPDIKEKVFIAKYHLQQSIIVKGVNRGVREMRRHYVGMFKNLNEFKELRLQLVTENNPDKVIELLDKIEKIYS